MKKILFVDDEKLMLSSFRRMFKDEYDIWTAESAKDAIDLLEKDSDFAVVVSDMEMPNMSGIELLKYIRERFPLIVRILLTGKADLNSSIEAVNQGNIYKFLTKPVKKASLQAFIDSAIEFHNLAISKAKEMDEHKNIAITDALTQLSNRFYLEERLSQIIALSKRENRDLAVLFLDIDGFKNVNDSYGHSIGDLVLKQVAKKLVKSVRSTDIVARYGGDEFIIVLINPSEHQNTGTICGLLIEEIKQKIKINDIECQIGISIGISEFPQDGNDMKALIEKADSAMYESKKNGGNRFTFYQS